LLLVLIIIASRKLMATTAAVRVERNIEMGAVVNFFSIGEKKKQMMGKEAASQRKLILSARKRKRNDMMNADHNAQSR